jgi:type II secretory pathway component PulF
MPVFEYRAMDETGRAVTGTLFSTSLSAAADELSKKGFNVQHVAIASQAPNDPIPQNFNASRKPEAPRAVEPKPEPKPIAPSGPPPTTARPAIVTEVISPLIYQVPLSQLLFLFRQLATMINAGVPMVSSLDTLARQTRDPKLQPVVVELLGHVREGRELSVGMQRYPDVFTPLMLSLVRTGERSGFLDKALLQMADYVEQEMELRNVVRKVTLYPKIVIGSSIVVIIGANYVIHEMTGKPGTLTSPLTEPATWVFLLPMIAFLFLFFRIGVRNSLIREGYDRILLMIPAIGGTVHQMAMAKFSRAFAALYKGGVSMGQCVTLSADACGSSYLRSLIYPSAKWLEEGMGITEAMRRTGAFSPQVLDMTQTGETTGRIDDMLDKVADYYEGESSQRAHQLAMILGVVCFLAVAVYVGYLVITFYSSDASNYRSLGA